MRAGRTVVPPMAKAMMSVAEVTVIAPPAEAIVSANLNEDKSFKSQGTSPSNYGKMQSATKASTLTFQRKSSFR